VSGCTDYFAEDEKSGLATCRNIVATLNVHPKEAEGRLPSRPPLYDPEELPFLIPYELQNELDIYEVGVTYIGKQLLKDICALCIESLVH
jgi:3-methylcrotonyl-CoA carboxylase beta subunit